MDLLDLQMHRRLIDQDYEIKQAREEVARWARIQALVGNDFVQKVIVSRRKSRQMYGLEPKDHKLTIKERQAIRLENKYMRPNTVGPTTGRDNPDMARRTSMGGPLTGGGRAGDRPQTSPAGPGAGKREQRRPKTTLGFFKRREEEGGKPGRSYLELKDLTDIDKMSEANKTDPRTEKLKERTVVHVKEAEVLQKRIQDFYTDLYQFKKGSAESELETHFNLWGIKNDIMY